MPSHIRHKDKKQLVLKQIGPRALIVEGGAMRGVFSCGILDRFLTENFSPFDSFWGVSAGASNLAAFLAQMPKRNLRIYTDYSLRKEFLSPWRWLRGHDFMDLDWMWHITLKELGIDKAALAADPRPFFLGVTRQDTGEAEYLCPDVDALAETMKASSALPILYRNGVQLGQHRYIDGGLSDAIPVTKAIAQGATQIMVLRSRPASYRKSANQAPRLMRHLLRKTPALITPMLTRHERYNQTIELMQQPPAGVTIVEICPPEDFPLERLSQKRSTLEQGYDMGYACGQMAMEQWQQLVEQQAD